MARFCLFKMPRGKVSGTFVQKPQTQIPSCTMQRPQARWGTVHVLYTHVKLPPDGDASPQHFPKPQIGPYVQDTRTGIGGELGWEITLPLGRRGAADGGWQEQGEQATLSLGTAVSMPALFTLTVAQGHLRKKDQGIHGPALHQRVSKGSIQDCIRTVRKRPRPNGCWGTSYTLTIGQEKGRDKSSLCSLKCSASEYVGPHRGGWPSAGISHLARVSQSLGDHCGPHRHRLFCVSGLVDTSCTTLVSTMT